MLAHQLEFIEFAIRSGALRFGNFTLKSGRRSPYFFNAGLFSSGDKLLQLGRFYAATLERSQIGYDMLYGPAYKGIPLACATAIALAERYAKDVGYAFNRKEAKDHGEGGSIVGAPLAGRVLIIDDVITAGTAIRESLSIIRAAGAQAVGVAVLLDRQERGQGALSAIQEVEREHGLKALAIAGLADLVELMRGDAKFAGQLPAVEAYRAAYGV